MILSDAVLSRRVREGSLKVEPFDEGCLTPNGLDLRIGEEAAYVLPGPEYASRKVLIDEELDIPANSVVLILTKERLEMPSDIVAQVNLRSTYARLGFVIPGTVVDAGFKGRLTLQVHSPPYPTVLPKGERFWHLIFFESYPASKGYQGRYQGGASLMEGAPAEPKR